jgi:hypothetical protein
MIIAGIYSFNNGLESVLDKYPKLFESDVDRCFLF